MWSMAVPPPPPNYIPKPNIIGPELLPKSKC